MNYCREETKQQQQVNYNRQQNKSHLGVTRKQGRMTKALCTDASGNTCKDELPIFTNNVPKVLLIFLRKEILAMAERFEWFDEAAKGNNDAKAKLIFQHVWRALKGTTQRKLAELMKNHHN